jgi:hypothetical protein
VEEPDGGSANPALERHMLTAIRASVAQATVRVG